MTNEAQAQTACPVRGMRPADRIGFPTPKAVFVQTVPGEDGRPERHLFSGDRHVVFDEPELFTFAETLGRSGAFRVGDAAGWTDQPFERIEPLLATLLDEGVLVRDPVPTAPSPSREKPSPLPAAPAGPVRTWTRDCESITADLAGGPIELGHLELFVPVFRVAHSALDADGRQVGEANVFPRPLRVEVPTTWLECSYPGSRHRVDRPMNHTALSAMRMHWPVMMAAVADIRARYLARFGRKGDGWTVGEVERLATMVLAVATLPLVRPALSGPAEPLHPVLAGLFRVSDGLRMATHQMMMVPGIGPMFGPDDPVDAATIHDYAERNRSFHSETGVCAGPRQLVAEFLATLLDGAVRAVATPDPAVAKVLAEADLAFDYGLLGLRAHAAAFRFWPAMAESYLVLDRAVGDAAAAEPGLAPLAGRLRAVAEGIRSASHLATGEARAARVAVYGHLYRETGIATGDVDLDLEGRIAALRADQVGLAETIAARLGRRFGTRPRAVRRIADVLADLAATARATLTVASLVQCRLNDRIGRAPPRRPFRLRDLDAHNRLQGAAGRTPFLFDLIAEETGVAITVDTHAIRLGRSFP